jgi:hypothetical protein
MSGNTVKINNTNELNWYVGDSKIDELMEWLDKNAEKISNKDNPDVTKMEKLKFWVDRLVFSGKPEEFIQISESFKTENEEVREICFYTNEYKYRIYAVDRKKDEGYLGCQVSARKMRPGEDWTRGNDLADGKFNEETWNSIIASIVRYELIQLSKYIKPDGRPEDN